MSDARIASDRRRARAREQPRQIGERIGHENHAVCPAPTGSSDAADPCAVAHPRQRSRSRTRGAARCRAAPTTTAYRRALRALRPDPRLPVPAPWRATSFPPSSKIQARMPRARKSWIAPSTRGTVERIDACTRPPSESIACVTISDCSCSVLSMRSSSSRFRDTRSSPPRTRRPGRRAARYTRASAGRGRSFGPQRRSMAAPSAASR